MRPFARLGLAFALFTMGAACAPALARADVAPSCSGRCDVGPRRAGGAGAALGFIAGGATLLGLLQLRQRRRR